MIRRLIYLHYYVLNTSLSDIRQLVRFVKNETNISTMRIWIDMVISSLQYNISLMDYFSLRFYNLSKSEREEYIGSGAMYEYQLIMNPRKHRKVLSDKIEFLKKFNDLTGRKWASLKMIEKGEIDLADFLGNSTGKIVLKHSKGQAGKQVEVCETSGLNKASLVEKMKRCGFDLIETYVLQNDLLMRLSPSGLNTVRIVTQVTKNNITVLTARLRASINSAIDNVSAGNIAMPINICTGEVCGPGIYADITKKDEYEHPVTGVPLVGLKIPFWKECIQLVIIAAKRIAENRSVGWDIGITNEGPVLIEGNHNWNYLMWQMPERKGFKKKYMEFLGQK